MKRHLEKQLLIWKDRTDRCPLILRGARQVGKSYLVEAFGKKHFDNFVVIDFERNPRFHRCFQTKEPVDILLQLEIVCGSKIQEGKTLLFLDEIQNCKEALASLRYFKELMPKLHVIAAGSLMEFLLNDDQFSFPVGRVEFAYLRPLSFQEYLEAVAPLAAERLKEFSLNKQPLPVEHEKFLDWVRRYLFIGGMPAAVSATLAESSFLEAERVHQMILQAYENDFGKYASLTQHKRLRTVFERAPILVAQHLKYTHLDQDLRSRDLKGAIEMLSYAGLINRAFATTASGLPLHAHVRENKIKLYFLDVGLLQTTCHVNAADFFESAILQINAGSIAEQFVAQELLAQEEYYQNKPLLFWQKGGSGQAEVDFVITHKGVIIPIEVKAGATGSLRSLRSFLEFQKKTPFGVRISEQPLSLVDGVFSIPFYLIGRICDFLEELNKV